MIRAVIIVNNHGKPRLTKFYEHYVRPRTCRGAAPHRQCRSRDPGERFCACALR